MTSELIERLKNGIVCPKPEDLIHLGESFGKLLQNGDIITLQGPLGVGKTAFTKGIARALGIMEIVTSPTFNIMTQYLGSKNLIHIDAYRLNEGEYLEFFEEIAHPYVMVVEWPQNLIDLRDYFHLDLSISIQKNEYRLVHLKNEKRESPI